MIIDAGDVEGPLEQLVVRGADYANSYKAYFDEQSMKAVHPRLCYQHDQSSFGHAVLVIGVRQTVHEARVIADLAQ